MIRVMLRALSGLTRGTLPLSGATGVVLKRSLAAMGALIDQALGESEPGTSDANYALLLLPWRTCCRTPSSSRKSIPRSAWSPTLPARGSSSTSATAAAGCLPATWTARRCS